MTWKIHIFDANDANTGARFNDISIVGTVTVIPEPGTICLFGLGIAGLIVRRKRRIKSLPMATIVVLVLGLISPAAFAGTIVFHSDANPKDANATAWETLLTNAGHTVIWRNDLTTLDAAKIAQMEAADLVFISRDTNSGDYINGTEISDWNGITTPLILASQYLTRNSRWLWVNNTDTANSASGTLVANDPGHPIFANVTLDGSNQVSIAGANSAPSVLIGTNNADVLATDTAGRGLVLHWTAGTEFYAGSGQTAGGDRMFIYAPAGPGSLTADGQQIFLDSVAYMIPEPGTICLLSLGLGGLIARRRRR